MMIKENVIETPIVLENKNTILRPITRDDYTAVFKWRNDLVSLYLWSYPRRLLSRKEFEINFENSLEGYIDIYLLIVDKSTEQPIGFVYNYDTSTIDAFTFLALYLRKDRRRQGTGKTSVELFIDYLFAYFPFRKIYVEAFEFNYISVGFSKAYGLKQEGYFPNHRWYGSKFWGVYRFALYRDDWPKMKERANLGKKSA